MHGPIQRLLDSPVYSLELQVAAIGDPLWSVIVVDTWIEVPALKTACDPLASPTDVELRLQPVLERSRTLSVA